MKNRRFLLILCVLIAALALGVSAEEKTVYIGGTSEGTVHTFADAVKALDGAGGRIVLCENATVTAALTVPEQAGDLTVTSQGGTLTLASKLTFAKNTNENVITFDCPIAVSSGITMYGGFNSLHFTKNCIMTGKPLNFYGGVLCAEGPSDGIISASDANNRACITELPYSITVEEGNFGIFECGSNRSTYTSILGSIAAPLTVRISGGTFGKAVSYKANDPLKLERAISLSGMSILASDALLEITGGTFNAPIYAQGYLGNTCTRTSGGSQVTKSDPKYYASTGDITVKIAGGTFLGCEISAEQTGPTYNQVLRGNFTLTVSRDAELASGTVLDATQVKSYPGAGKVASVTYPNGRGLVVKRFDIENGKAQTYDEPIRIACVGDSITQGTGVGNGDPFQTYSYPSLLLQKIAASGTDVIVSNYGCGATHVLNYSGLWYNDMLAYTLSMEECDADYVVVGLGTNDVATVCCIGQVEHFREVYTDLIAGYAARPSTKCVYGTSAIYRLSRTSAAVSVIRAVQEEVLNGLRLAGKKAAYIDLYALLLDDCLAGKVLGSDNLHPNKSGYVLYTDAIYNAIFDGVTAPDNFFLKDIWVSAAGKRNGAGTKDDPISDIVMALSKAANGATVHIVGTVVHDQTRSGDTALGDYVPFNTPVGRKLTLVGEGTDAVLSIQTKLFNLYGDLTFDNLTLRYTGSTALYIACNYHNAEFTDTFRTTGTDGAVLVGGCLAFNGDESATWYNSEKSISSDRDCTLTVNGGSYAYLIGGNRQWQSSTNAGNALYGTYGGNMRITVGKNVRLALNPSYVKYNAAVGQNYLTGSCTVVLETPVAVFNAYAFAGEYDATRAAHDESRNTGKVRILAADGITVRTPLTGDFSGNGVCSLYDALLLLRYAQSGFDASKAENFYYKTKVTEQNAVRALARLAG